MKKIFDKIKSIWKYILYFLSGLATFIGVIFTIIFFVLQSKEKEQIKNNEDLINTIKGNKDEKDVNNIDNDFNNSPFNQ